MKFTCFDLDLYSTDADIPTIAKEIDAPSSEDAAEIYAGLDRDRVFPLEVVVIGEGYRDVWEVEMEVVYLLKTSLQHSIQEGWDELF